MGLGGKFVSLFENYLKYLKILIKALWINFLGPSFDFTEKIYFEKKAHFCLFLQNSKKQS